MILPSVTQLLVIQDRDRKLRQMQHHLEQLLRWRYGQKSERIDENQLFFEALAAVLESGRMAAAWFDSMDPGMLEAGRPLHEVDNLQITPRVASTTRESRIRSAWGVARRIDEVLRHPGAAGILSEPQEPPTEPFDLATGQASA